MRIFYFLLTILLGIGLMPAAHATTWDEPWHEQVVKEADAFVLAKVTSSDEEKGLTASIIRTLGGTAVPTDIRITDFYALHLCSTSSGHGPEFHFSKADTCYFFLKKNAAGYYSIATPSTGAAPMWHDSVKATYRHSYHQALVSRAVYEPTMTAIFQHYHQQPFDATFIREFVTQALALPPASLDAAGLPLFFRQHVALECIYHLNLPGYYAAILPFLHNEANMHAQISAARALTGYNTPDAQRELLALLKAKAPEDFTKAIAVRTLASYKPTELKPELKKLAKSASDERNGFGGNIMDPRVCTSLPSVKAALTALVAEL